MAKRKLCYDSISTEDGVNNNNHIAVIVPEIVCDFTTENTVGSRTSLDDIFQYNGINNSTKCLVGGCEITFSGYYKSTLRRHIIICHAELIDVIEPIKRRCTYKAKCEKSRIVEIRKLLVELATVHGRPLMIVNDEPMVKILKMAANSEQKIFTREQLKEDIFEAERQIKFCIVEEVKGKMVSVMTDITVGTSR